MNNQWHGSLLVLASAVCFGLVPIFARFAYANSVSVQSLLFTRFLSSFILIGIFLRLTNRIYMPSKNQFSVLMALGGIVYFLQAFLYFTSFLYVSVSVAVLVANTYPVFVIMGSLALKWEKLSASIVLSLLLALVGLVLLINPVFSGSIVGSLMAFFTGVTYAFYVLVSTRVLKGLSGEVSAFYLMGASSVSFGISGLLTNELNFAWNPEAWLWVGVISLICTALAITILLQGLKMLGPSRTSVLGTLEPAIAVIAASIIFNESLSITQWIGGLLILFVMIFTALLSKSKN
jgi:drug/metabolite transporter (DMT)-like permease